MLVEIVLSTSFAVGLVKRVASAILPDDGSGLADATDKKLDKALKYLTKATDLLTPEDGDYCLLAQQLSREHTALTEELEDERSDAIQLSDTRSKSFRVVMSLKRQLPDPSFPATEGLRTVYLQSGELLRKAKKLSDVTSKRSSETRTDRPMRGLQSSPTVDSKVSEKGWRDLRHAQQDIPPLPIDYVSRGGRGGSICPRTMRHRLAEILVKHKMPNGVASGTVPVPEVSSTDADPVSTADASDETEKLVGHVSIVTADETLSGEPLSGSAKTDISIREYELGELREFLQDLVNVAFTEESVDGSSDGEKPVLRFSYPLALGPVTVMDAFEAVVL